MLRIAIVGAGPNAAGHARWFAQSGRSTVVAVADPLRERAEALAKEVGAKPVADLSQALDGVDAVVVSSPNFLHREHALAVCAAGKHLWCEKPMGLDLAEARDIATAVAKAKVVSQVGFSPRNNANLLPMIEDARAGRYGSLLSVISRRLMWMDMSKAQGWRADPAKSGGLLMEINIHELDWMMAVAGEVDWVFARTWSAKGGHPRANDHVWVTLGFSAGATGLHEGGWLSATPNFYRGVQGTEGGASTDEWGNKLYRAKLGANRSEDAEGAGFDLRANFLDAIAGTAAADCDCVWALKVMAVGEAVFASAAAGRPVRLAELGMQARG